MGFCARALATALVAVVASLLVAVPATRASFVPDAAMVSALAADGRGAVACFGDFNSDKHADLFTARYTAESKSEVSVFTYSSSESRFLLATTVTVENRVVSLFANDVDRDGKLDVLAFTTGARGAISVVFLRGDLHTLAVTELLGFTGADAPASVPAVIDYDNDFYSDFIGAAAGAAATERVVWRNTGEYNDDGKYVFTRLSVGTSTGTGEQFSREVGGAQQPLALPAGHAFVDLNGDCLSDVFLISETDGKLFGEVWVNNNQCTSGHCFTLERTIPLPAGAGAPVFADVDADGTLDLIFPVCLPGGAAGCAGTSEIHVVYNQQQKMCKSLISPGRDCRRQQNLCVADDNFKFDESGAAGAHHVVMPFPTGMRLYDASAASGAAALDTPPLALRVGDPNNDGFPDIVVPIIDTTTNAVFMQLWRNLACVANAGPSAGAPPCTEAAVAEGRRGFYPLAADNTGLTSVTNAYAAGFMDVNNNGWIDLIVLQLTTDAATNKTAVVPHALLNKFDEDAYFITLMGINGACPSWCPSEPRFPSPRAYGATAPGATFKFTITSLSGTKSVRQVAQLSQSSMLPLQTPYAHSGLGRTANYVEEVFAGFPIANSRHYNMWVAMVPNAQLVVFPFPHGSPSSWTLELFVSPSTRLFWVGIAFVVTLGILAVTIYVFHRKEKAEDNKERRAQLNSYFFTGR